MLLASAHFLALLSPGPDFFLIIQASLRLPLRYGIGVCSGIASANFVYLAMAIFGIEIIKELTAVMLIMKYLGAVYLIFIGIMLLRAPSRPLAVKNTSGFLLAHHFGKQFMVGFMSAILNPKNAVFYLSLFTVMVSPATPLLTRCLYGLWMTSIVFFWDLLVVFVFGRQQVRDTMGKGIFWIEKMSGVMLAFFGLILPFT